MIRVHLSGDRGSVDFPNCNGFTWNADTQALSVYKDGEVVAGFRSEAWAWVQDHGTGEISSTEQTDETAPET